MTPHDGYRYFAEHYGLDVLGTLTGTTTEEQPSAHRVRQLVVDVRRTGVPALFSESTVPPALIEQVAREADVRVAGPLYADFLGPPGSGLEDYAGMMRHNVDVIVEALRAGGNVIGISLRRVSVRRGPHEVLHEVDLVVPHGRVTGLYGRTGQGSRP